MPQRAHPNGRLGQRASAIARRPGSSSIFSEQWRNDMIRETPDNPKRKFDDQRMRVFLEHYAMHGLEKHAAIAAGVTLGTVLGYRDKDEQFDLACMEAEAYYRDVIRDRVGTQSQGVPEDVYGGPDKNDVVGQRLIFPSNPLLMMEAKRVDPTYRDSSKVDVAVSGGVLVVPAATSTQEWEKTLEQERQNLVNGVNRREITTSNGGE